jgi:hypothetical protein
MEHAAAGYQNNYSAILLFKIIPITLRTYEALLAVPDGESQDTVNNSLTFALLWSAPRGKSSHLASSVPFFFGCNDMNEELTPRSRAAFERMMQDLGIYRHPLASDTRHPLYRAQAERWLESLVRTDVTRVDCALGFRLCASVCWQRSGTRHH